MYFVSFELYYNYKYEVDIIKKKAFMCMHIEFLMVWDVYRTHPANSKNIHRGGWAKRFLLIQKRRGYIVDSL